VLYCNFKKLSVKAVQVVHYQLTEDGIPFDAQGLVLFDQVRLAIFLDPTHAALHFSSLPNVASLTLFVYSVTRRIMCLTFIVVFSISGVKESRFVGERDRRNVGILFYQLLGQLPCLVYTIRRPIKVA
jgi:hypothetical protein